jgi:hypothetical protein
MRERSAISLNTFNQGSCESSMFSDMKKQDRGIASKLTPHMMDLPQPKPEETSESFAKRTQNAFYRACKKAEKIVKHSIEVNLSRISGYCRSRGGNLRAYRSHPRSRSMALSNGGSGDSDSGDPDQSDPPEPWHNNQFVVKTSPNQIKPNISALFWQCVGCCCAFERGRVA